ncbi:hypothetical protein BKA69DRAFT_618369 [Paraphysoderma sedebokerense]|nr:hypothetical protein BKA69DRAFT_618369 [Paraphysoderma sedebokerense]
MKLSLRPITILIIAVFAICLQVSATPLPGPGQNGPNQPGKTPPGKTPGQAAPPGQPPARQPATRPGTGTNPATPGGAPASPPLPGNLPAPVAGSPVLNGTDPSTSPNRPPNSDGDNPRSNTTNPGTGNEGEAGSSTPVLIIAGNKVITASGKPPTENEVRNGLAMLAKTMASASNNDKIED